MPDTISGGKSDLIKILELLPNCLKFLIEEINKMPDEQATKEQMRFKKSEVDILSPREIEVIKLIAAGMLNKEIACKLHISGKTAKNHVYRIFAKLNVSNRVEAASYAFKHNIAIL